MKIESPAVSTGPLSVLATPVSSMRWRFISPEIQINFKFRINRRKERRDCEQAINLQRIWTSA